MYFPDKSVSFNTLWYIIIGISTPSEIFTERTGTLETELKTEYRSKAEKRILQPRKFLTF